MEADDEGFERGASPEVCEVNAAYLQRNVGAGATDRNHTAELPVSAPATLTITTPPPSEPAVAWQTGTVNALAFERVRCVLDAVRERLDRSTLGGER